MKRFIHRIHILLALPAGLIICLICLSGAALVFEDEIMKACFPSRYYAAGVKDAPLPLDRLMEEVNSQLPDTLEVAAVRIPSDPEENYRMSFAGRSRTHFLYADPYSGQVRDIYNAQGNFFNLMMRLHRWLLTPFRAAGTFPAGKIIVGVASLIFVFILLSGCILWCLRCFGRGRSRGLGIRFGAGRKRLLYDLHVAGGIYAAGFLLALTLTGLTFSFSWYRTGFYRLLGAGVSQVRQGAPQGNRGGGGGGRPERSRPEARPDYAVWQQVAARLRADYPSCKSITLQPGRASVAIRGAGNVRASDSYAFDPLTGEFTEVSLYKNLDRASRLRGWIYSVHTGSWGGWLTRILSFLAALVGASLPLTGCYLLLKRARRTVRRS
jgi:uncharacterized iron-regulated membrane protein